MNLHQPLPILPFHSFSCLPVVPQSPILSLLSSFYSYPVFQKAQTGPISSSRILHYNHPLPAALILFDEIEAVLLNFQRLHH